MKRIETNREYNEKVNEIIKKFQFNFKNYNSNFKQDEAYLIPIDSLSILLEINLNYLYSDVDTSYSNIEVDSFITYLSKYDEYNINSIVFFDEYKIIEDSINAKLASVVENQKDIYTITINRVYGENVPNDKIAVMTTLILGKGGYRIGLLQFNSNQPPIRYGLGQKSFDNDILVYGGLCNSDNGGGNSQSGSFLLTLYANINLSLQPAIAPSPGYKLSYISLPSNQQIDPLSPHYYYNSDNPFYNNSNANLPRSQSNTTYPTEIFAHIGYWESNQIEGTFGTRHKGPCMDYIMLNYYLNKMPVLAQRIKNQYSFLVDCYPVRFTVYATEHIQSGTNCYSWPSGNKPPLNLAISAGYCPDGEHNLKIEFKKAVIIPDPGYGN